MSGKIDHEHINSSQSYNRKQTTGEGRGHAPNALCLAYGTKFLSALNCARLSFVDNLETCFFVFEMALVETFKESGISRTGSASTEGMDVHASILHG